MHLLYAFREIAVHSLFAQAETACRLMWHYCHVEMVKLPSNSDFYGEKNEVFLFGTEIVYFGNFHFFLLLAIIAIAFGVFSVIAV